MNSPTETDDAVDLFAARSDEATCKASQAFARLLKLAEERDSGQIPRIARFLATTYNGHAFQLDPFELRSVDMAISDDMLCCLDHCAGAVPTCTRSFLTVTPACAP